MIAGGIMLYLFVALGWFRLRVIDIRENPELMPGGGPWVVLLTCLTWPLIVALAIVALVVIGITGFL